ncbi:MAG: orotidine 5'-phosphate decarboxylase [Nitrososphaeraceae archaeon]
MSSADGFSARIWKSSERKQSNIILALDPIRKDDLDKYLTETIALLQSRICAIKFNFHVIVPLARVEITKIIQMCHSYGIQVIADIKLNDIPSTNELTLEYLIEEGFDAVIANPIIGRLEIVELTKKAHSLGGGILALVYMSHPGASQTYGMQVYDETEGPGKRKVPLYKILLRYAREASVDGIVIGATKPDIVKDVASSKPAPIFSPGIGPQGGSISEASKYGVDYFIVGRSIIQSSEPLKTLELLNDSLRKC